MGSDVGASVSSAPLGFGYDSILGELRSRSVTGEVRSADTRQKAKITVCKGMLEVSSALRIDQSLSVNYVGTASVDEKMTFIKEQKITQESVSIVVYARREEGSIMLDNPKFDTSLNKENPNDFVWLYGDSYVKSVSRGGEYYAIYTFHTETSEAQDSLSASLKTKLDVINTSASVDMTLKNLRKETKTSWTFNHEMRGIKGRALPNPEDIMAFAETFSSLELNSPVEIGRTTGSYRSVPGFATDFTNIIANGRYFLGSAASPGLAGSLARIASLQNKVAWLRDIYDCYGFEADPKLDEFAELLESDRVEIAEQFIAYSDDPEARQTKPQLTSLTKGIPMLRYDKGESPAWGGPGGGPWGIGSVEEAIHNQLRLTSIKISGRRYVDRLDLVYTDRRGKRPEETFGNSTEGARDPLVLDEGEFPEKFHVRCGELVDRIEIWTDRGGWVWAGWEGGNPNDWRVPEGARVIGFKGRAGEYIDQFQVVWARLKPAEFVKPRNVVRNTRSAPEPVAATV